MVDFWKHKRVAVLGGGGFIGSHIAEELVKKGASVTITVKRKDEKHLKNVRHIIEEIKVIEAELRSAEASKGAIDEQQIVINAAAVDGSSKFKKEYPVEIFHDNVLILLNVVSALKEMKVDHFIQFSSAAIYYSENVMRETDNIFLPIDLQYAYSWSKMFSEIISKFYSLKYGAKVLVIRPSNIFGLKDIADEERMRLIPYLISEIKKGTTKIKMKGPGNQILSFLYVDDFVINLLRMIKLQKKSFDVVNIGSEEEISLRDLCYAVADLMNSKVKFVFDADTPQPIRKTIDLTKAKEDYNFRQTISLKEGLKKLLSSKE